MTTINLPELPPLPKLTCGPETGHAAVWVPAQMHAYATAYATQAVEQDRAGRWQPIATAPKSVDLGRGRIKAIYFLAYCPDPEAVEMESCVCVCWWEPLMNNGKGQWFGEGNYPLRPTHWQPLAAPPVAAIATSQGDPA